jgi:hypothetical protein
MGVPDIVETGRAYQDLGVYAALAILSFIVVYLYRRIESLHKELRVVQTEMLKDTQTCLRDTQTCLRDATAHIKESTQALRTLNDTCSQIRVETLSGSYRTITPQQVWAYDCESGPSKARSDSRKSSARINRIPPREGE